MSVDLYSFVGMYDRALATLGHVLDKGAAHAVEAGGSEDDILAWRLADDMNPLDFQIRIVVNFTRKWAARAAGIDLPADVDEDEGRDLSGYRTAIADGRAFLATLKPGQFEGRDAEVLEVTLGNGMDFAEPVEKWMTGFATVNVYFHLSTAYAILRARGVQLGKLDLFPDGL